MKNLKWHSELKSDIAMLIKHEQDPLDLLEVFCAPTSTMTQTAKKLFSFKITNYHGKSHLQTMTPLVALSRFQNKAITAQTVIIPVILQRAYLVTHRT